MLHGGFRQQDVFRIRSKTMKMAHFVSVNQYKGNSTSLFQSTMKLRLVALTEAIYSHIPNRLVSEQQSVRAVSVHAVSLTMTKR